jgi:hypothetical protein
MKLNKYQADFMTRRKAYQALLKRYNEIERDYIQSKNIVNEDGVIPAGLWLIDNDDTFKNAVEKIGYRLDELGIPEAKEALGVAEDNLIKYGLSIMPVYLKKERQIMENSCFGLNGYSRNYTTRMQMIESTMGFDTSKVPAWAKVH